LLLLLSVLTRPLMVVGCLPGWPRQP